MGGKSKKPRYVANRANASNRSQTVSNRNYKANLIKASSSDDEFTMTLESELSQERRELFRKKLSESDVKTHLKIEHSDALEFFPILSNDKDKVFHEVSDSHAKLWRFEPKADTDDTNGGIFLCGDWKKFSEAKGLGVNDEVIFYENQGFWMIDIERNCEKDGRQGDFIGLGKRKTMAQTGHKEMEGHLNMMTNTMVTDNAPNSSETLLNFSSEPNLLLSPSSHSFGPPYSQTEITNRSRMDKLGPIISSDDCVRDNAYGAKEFPGTLVNESAPKAQEYRELFRKKLSKSDVEDHLKLEKNSMLNNFLHFTNENNVVSLELLLGNNNKEIPLELSLYDFVHNLWKFTGYLNSEDAETLYFNNGWKDFVGARDVMENDIVVFYDFDSDQGEVKERCLMIDIEPHDAKAREDHFNMMPKSMVANIARKSSQTLLNVSPDPSPQLALCSHSFELPHSQAEMANRSCKHNLAARAYGHDADEVPGRSLSQGGKEYRELFRKKLAKTDVEDYLRLSNDGMLNNFVKFQNESNAVSLGLPLRNDDKEIPLELEVYDDSEHVLWKFTGYQSSEAVQVLYFNNGWKDFVKTKGVKENDIIVFNNFVKGCGEHEKSCLMISIERNGEKVRELRCL